MPIVALCAVTATLAFVVALLVGANAERIASLFGLLDYPDTDGGRKRHAKVTPLVGGLGGVGHPACDISASRKPILTGKGALGFI